MCTESSPYYKDRNMIYDIKNENKPTIAHSMDLHKKL